MSLTGGLLKQRRLERANRSKYHSKRIESEIIIELKDKLNEYLLENEKVMLEVRPENMGEFLNILSESILSIYDYEQVDANKFVFFHKEISF